jgi:hypothetical protein
MEKIVSLVEAKVMAGSGNFFTTLPDRIERLNYLREGTPGIIYTDAPVPFINDAFYFESSPPFFCDEAGGEFSYEQVVNYVDEGQIVVQRELMAALKPRDQAALIIHEAIYAYRRGLGDTNSANTRRVVGYAFSTLSPKEFDEAVTPLTQPSPVSLSAGILKVVVGQVDSSGLSAVMRNVQVTIAGTYADSAEPKHVFELSKLIDGIDNVDFQIPSNLGSGLQNVSIAVKFPDEIIKNWIAPEKWSSDLVTSTGKQRHFCEANSLFLPDESGFGMIAIVCTKN